MLLALPVLNMLRWVLRFLRRRRLARTSAEEMRFHVESAVAALVRDGMRETEARRHVRLTMGHVDAEVERLSDVRPGAALEALVRDVRQAVRALWRAPVLVVVAVLLVALGVGASTAVFTLVERVVVRPLPLPEPDRLVRLYETSAARGIERADVSRGTLAEWRSRARSFEGLAVSYAMGRTIVDGDRADVAVVAQVSCDFFTILALRPALGSAFTPSQCRAARFTSAAAPISTDPVVILAHDYWQNTYGSDRQIVGRTVLVDRRPFRVLGVMPAEASVVLPGVAAYIAWELEESLPFDQRYTTAFGRLRADATLETSSVELNRIAGEIAVERPETNRDWGVQVVRLHDDTVRTIRPVLTTLLVAACLLLLIACANVAILLSARGLARAHEVSIHLALGGSRARLLRQGLLESGVLAVAGGALGVVVAYGAVTYVRRAWLGLPRAGEVGPDGAAFAFALGMTLFSALLAGILPAWRHARSEPIDALRGGRRATSSRQSGRVRDLLVTAEVALTVVLLCGAGLLVRSVEGLRSRDTGYDARDVTVAPVFLDGERYRSGAASHAYYQELFIRLRALPGVVAVGGATTLPSSQYGPDFARPVWPLSRAGDERSVRPASVRIVTPGYFDALRIKIIEGRQFTEQDAPNAPRVAAVSERLARALWPNRSAIGEQLVVDYASAGTYPYEVVGVVADVRFDGPRSEPLEEVYFPHAQRSYLILNVAVRGQPGSAPSPQAVRAVLRELDPLKPPQGVYRLDELLAATYQRER
ncbi:MAG: ABC transporter permease, partial [Gemmatimonadota bacterium]